MSVDRGGFRTAKGAPPVVSVLMPAYNAAAYLAAAVESLLGQSFGDFELIVVDDGSTDATDEVLAGIRDPRVVVHRQPENRGLVAALNLALVMARGRYIARQDADDLSLPQRLAAQVEELDRRADLVLLGTAYQVIDSDCEVTACHRPPASDTEIRWQMLFHNAFAHSSVMIRRSALEAGGLRYEESRVPAEDYFLWSRLLELGRAGNLTEPMIQRRIHPHQISELRSDHQQEQAAQVARENLAALGFDIRDPALTVLRKRMFGSRGSLTSEEIEVLASSAEILATLARQQGIGTAAMARVKRQWVRQVLVNLPVWRLREAWRTGLLPVAVRSAPSVVLESFALRLPRRLFALARVN